MKAIFFISLHRVWLRTMTCTLLLSSLSIVCVCVNALFVEFRCDFHAIVMDTMRHSWHSNESELLSVVVVQGSYAYKIWAKIKRNKNTYTHTHSPSMHRHPRVFCYIVCGSLNFKLTGAGGNGSTRQRWSFQSNNLRWQSNTPYIFMWNSINKECDQFSHNAHFSFRDRWSKWCATHRLTLCRKKKHLDIIAVRRV